MTASTASTRRDFLWTSVGFAGLLIGCRSEESEAPSGSVKRGDEGEGEVKREPSDPLSATPPATSALRPFRLDVRSAGGHAMATDGKLVVHEWMSWLRVRSDERVAELIVTRHNGDLVERPVGRFRQALDDAALLELQRAIESTPWTELPEPLIGDPTANWLSFEYDAGALVIEREFSASAQAFITAIGPLMERLNATMSAPLATPIAALAVEAHTAVLESGKRRLRLLVRNAGTEPVVITDPRVSGGDVGPRARLLVAAQPSGYQMPTWIGITLPALPAGQPEVRVLAAGESLAIDVDWKPILSGPCLLHAVWQDYAGPIRATPDQLPFMPLPEEGSSSPSGPYPVRGAAFSSYASFDA